MNLQSLLGMADYRSKDHWKFYPFGSAMNGQTSRLEATRQIIYALSIECVVETGTYRGTTAEWFAQFGIPVETVELSHRYFTFSKARLERFANVKVNQGSSVTFLKKRNLANPELKSVRHLFYLDAHWENYLPLRDELELIFNHYTHAVVLIDDFQVIDDPGYEYDNTGEPGKAINLEYLSHSKLPPLSIFFPTTAAREETGRRRGWVVLSSNAELQTKLEAISLLRKHVQ